MSLRKKWIAYMSSLFTAFAVAGCGNGGQKMDAPEWTIAVSPYFTSLEEWCSEMDDTVALFLSGNLSETEYMDRIRDMDDELSQLEENRNEPEIKVGSHNYETKLAEKGYGSLWSDLRSLSDELMKNNGFSDAPEQLVYLYLGYQEVVSGDIDDYMTGYLASGGTLKNEGESGLVE